jgi:hypothetical protein
MRSLVVSRQVDGLPPQAAAEPVQAANVVPRVWPELPLQVQIQLAQQMAQLLQRLRPPAESPREMHDAECGIGG